MTASSLVLYRPGPSTSLTTASSHASLISSRFFSQQTGITIVTELLYRLLFDIINRFLVSFQRLASKCIEKAASWVEQKIQEHRVRLEESRNSVAGGLEIVQEVNKLVKENGFIKCPMGETSRGPPQPPWVKSVLEGIEEGRLHDRDFYTNQW
ncbi:hypothetical protein GQ44DRAFT_709491 [Phaeosphaeriaceae sp. PMI808]|nr:hypothetical protein GQ44DRAFT_709491 [Phaeosphaeriaceae sp. PMI808]